jgi:nucleoside-diphosphate-sugar epimerase
MNHKCFIDRFVKIIKMSKKIVIGANGQIGSELVYGLVSKFGNDNVVASDINESKLSPSITFETLDVLDKNRLKKMLLKHNIKEVYILAAILSATAEKNPLFAWELNMNGLLNILELAKDKIIDKVFWPSSIAVFGPTTPQDNTPQLTIMEPSTVYGISKLAGERWCEYYNKKYGVDVRSIRYPGLISYKTLPGGGTTDYAVDIFHKAVKEEKYTCYLKEDTYLPMMFMEDAINATISLMDTNSKNVKIRSSYNVSGISFSPKEIAESIKKIIPNFTINYDIDFRQEIADSWPKSIDDSKANDDWGWENEFDLQKMTKVMLENLVKV